MEQRSEEWFSQRAGRVTASAIYKVMAKVKAGEAADRRNYRAQLVAERLSGFCADSFSNAAMQHGIDTEPQARAAYEFLHGRPVVEMGFADHPTIPMTGASPDGLVGDDGLIEIKCPNTATHIETLKGGKIDRKYIYQMHWQMICTGRKWCDFASFDPRLTEEMQLHVQRVDLDPELAAEIEEGVIAFLSEVDADVQKLTELYLKKKAA